MRPPERMVERSSHDLLVSICELLTEILREVSHVRATLDTLLALYERQQRTTPRS